ncbi:hypothetical protein B0T21DRAFT_383667 [Apiosordaria backusii]|uniref:Uncharacterized protein n=1 Tax=Apiosordaria backusii TaxID=314023 RepID=A0AA40BKW0_9PEZI|nr:hypothetical protein B0T21DRAFT_383667 [Apiosordaria backusii]
MASPSEAYGLSKLHIAAITGDFQRANKILKSEATVQEGKKKILEARNREGTTPLMTAILCARDYTRSSLFRAKLGIYQKLGLTPVSRSQQRKLLRSRRFGNHLFSGSKILKHSKYLIILKPSGEQFAVSSWMPNPGRGARVLDNAVFIEFVREVIHLYGLKVCGSQRDNRNQTALLEQKGRVLKKVLGTSDITCISDLRGVDISTYYKEARLFLNHGPCRDVSTVRSL